MNGWAEASGGGRDGYGCLSGLSVVADLHLIRSMCSAGGNASHGATAGKTGPGRRGPGDGCRRGGAPARRGFFVLDANEEESTAPVLVRGGGRGGSLWVGLFKELGPFGTGSAL